MLLTLDTALTSTGWAVFDDDRELVYCGSVQTKSDVDLSKRFDYVAASLTATVGRMFLDTIVAEVPQIYTFGKAKGDPNKLTPIWGLAGYVIGVLQPESFQLILPAVWKGDLKKTQMFAKIIRHMHPTELAIFNCDAFRKSREPDCAKPPKEKSKPGDVLDAIGIGLYTLGRL